MIKKKVVKSLVACLIAAGPMMAQPPAARADGGGITVLVTLALTSTIAAGVVAILKGVHSDAYLAAADDATRFVRNGGKGEISAQLQEVMDYERRFVAENAKQDIIDQFNQLNLADQNLVLAKLASVRAAVILAQS